MLPPSSIYISPSVWEACPLQSSRNKRQNRQERARYERTACHTLVPKEEVACAVFSKASWHSLRSQFSLAEVISLHKAHRSKTSSSFTEPSQMAPVGRRSFLCFNRRAITLRPSQSH